jgi:hypothetical protein
MFHAYYMPAPPPSHPPPPSPGRPVSMHPEGRMSLLCTHQQHVMHGIEDKSIFQHPKHHLTPSHFYLHEPPALGMVGINFVALYMILNYANKG